MRGKNLLWTCLVALLLTSVFMAGTVTAPASARMYVYPKEIRDMEPPANFTIAIKVDVANLYGWDFILSFDPGLLQVLNVTSGLFLEESGWDTAWGIGHVQPDINNLNGSVGAGDVIMADEWTGELPLQGVSGTGRVLATIEFQVINNGICVLDLESTELATVVGLPPYQTFTPIVHTVENGLFDNRPEKLPPVALFTVKHPGMVLPVAGQPITFDASDSNDADDGGWIVSYNWDFGDGTTGSGKVVDHTFAEVGTYLVSLTVTDNDGLSATASTSVKVVPWMEGGTFPDLLEAKPESEKWNEVSRGRELKLFGLVGNPTDQAFEVYVEFTIFSTEEVRKLGTIKTGVATVKGGETLELSAIMDLRDTRWNVGPNRGGWGAGKNLVWPEYTVFAKCYHNVSMGFEKGFVAKDFGFKVHTAKHDIAVLSVTTNATNGVPKGALLEISVNMANEGGGHYTEFFNITVTYKGITTPETVLEVRSSYLTGAKTAEGTRTETFILDTSQLKAERHIITVTLSTLTYELDTLDNSGSCIVTIVA